MNYKRHTICELIFLQFLIGQKLFTCTAWKGKTPNTYLDKLIKKATPKLQNINPDRWLRNLRGDYSLLEEPSDKW